MRKEEMMTRLGEAVARDALREARLLQAVHREVHDEAVAGLRHAEEALPENKKNRTIRCKRPMSAAASAQRGEIEVHLADGMRGGDVS